MILKIIFILFLICNLYILKQSYKNINYGIVFYIFILPFSIPLKIFFKPINGDKYIVVFQFLWIILLYCIVIFKGLLYKEKWKIYITKIDITIFLYLCLGFFQIIYTIFRASYIAYVLNGFRTHFFIIFLFFLIRIFYQDKYLRIYINAYKYSLLLGMLLMLFEAITSDLNIVNREVYHNLFHSINIKFTWDLMMGKLYRIYGLFAQPQASGVFCAITSLFYSISYITNLKNKKNIIFSIQLLFLLISLFTTFLTTSRSALMAFVFTFLIIIMYYRFIKIKLLIIPGMFAFGFGSFYVIRNINLFYSYLESIKNIILFKDFYYASVIEDFYSIFNIWKSNFLWGAGYAIKIFDLNKYGVIVNPGVVVSKPGWEVHYFSIMKQFGIFGISLFLLYNIFALTTVKKIIKQSKNIVKNSFLIFLVSTIIISFIASAHYDIYIRFGFDAYIYTAFAIISYYYSRKQSNEKNING